MPATVIKRLAKKAKCTIAKAENKWEKAKGIVKAEYGIDEGDQYFFAITTAIAKKLLKIHEAEVMGFKKFLSEASHYGSLVDPDKYSRLNGADKALYKYTADGFTDLSAHMDKLMKQYPYAGGVVYRGLHFDSKEQHDNFLSTIKGGKLHSNTFTSWTTHEATAEDFAHSKKTYFPDMAIMSAHKKMNDEGEHMSGYGGVVIRTKADKGIDVGQSEFAKESEVILPEGTYEVEVVKLLEPYKRAYGDVDKVKALIKQFKTATVRTKELDSKINYIIKSWLPKLDEEDVDSILKYELMKFFSFSKEEITDRFVKYEIENQRWNNTKRLRLDIFVPVDDRLYDKAGEKMQDKILRSLKAIGMGAKNALDALLAHDDMDEVSEFDIRGMDALRHFLPDVADKIAKPLRQHLGKRYHELNDRSVTKNLTTSDDIRAHGDKIKNLVQAMQSV